eukprot:4154319-Amphidinium_carterae.1
MHAYQLEDHLRAHDHEPAEPRTARAKKPNMGVGCCALSTPISMSHQSLRQCALQGSKQIEAHHSKPFGASSPSVQDLVTSVPKPSSG